MLNFSPDFYYEPCYWVYNSTYKAIDPGKGTGEQICLSSIKIDHYAGPISIDHYQLVDCDIYYSCLRPKPNE